MQPKIVPSTAATCPVPNAQSHYNYATFAEQKSQTEEGSIFNLMILLMAFVFNHYQSGSVDVYYALLSSQFLD